MTGYNKEKIIQKVTNELTTYLIPDIVSSIIMPYLKIRDLPPCCQNDYKCRSHELLALHRGLATGTRCWMCSKKPNTKIYCWPCDTGRTDCVSCFHCSKNIIE